MGSPLLDYLFAFVGDMHYQMGMLTRCPELELKVEGVITLFFLVSHGVSGPAYAHLNYSCLRWEPTAGHKD